MLNYAMQYNFVNSIFLTFNGGNKKKISNVSHSQEVMDRYKKFFPYTKYLSFTQNDFVMSCIYIMFKYSPSSVNSMLQNLQNLNFDEVKQFIIEIKSYKELMRKDVEHLENCYGKPTLNQVFQEYSKKNIYWFTLYWYWKLQGEPELTSIIQKQNITKIKGIFLYISFSESSLIWIKNLLSKETLEI